MNQIWVGSDWHLWNTNNNYAHPYRSDTDIKQFIDKIDTLPIQKDDLVLFLGDFADILDPDPYKIQWILDKIPGTKIMVYGNHDIEDMSFWLTAGFDGVTDMVTIHHMIFTHFPIHVGEEYINFHGHLHTEKFSQLDARWVNVYNPDMPFTRLDDVLEKIQYNNHIATHTDANIFPFEAKGIKDTMDKYTNVLDLSDEFPLVPQDESVIKNQEDIYYNKEKFDSGEINLCFITGHSGSGKSTMGRDMQQHGIEHYELDDLVFIKDRFTMANLKEYGELIYSFFNGPGKKYYVTKKYIIDNNVPSSEYEDKMFIDFVNYTKRYAKSHPKTKIVLEGVWLFEPGWFKPEEFKDYAFYIKGTSMMISSIRAAKRNAKADHPAGGAKYQLEVLRQTLAPDALKWYITNEKQIQQYVKYFTRLMKQGNLNESIASTLDPNFVSKEPIKLSSLKRVRITKAVIDKYKSTYPDLRHVRCEDTKEYKCNGYIWLDNQGDLVAHVGSCEYNDDHTKWIVSLEVIPKFKGHGLAKQILDYATKTMHCKYLSVNKKNKLAKSIYDKYGFKVYYEDKNMYYMTVDPNPQVISESQTLNEVLFDDIADTEYWEQDDEYKPGSRKKEPMAEDYEEVKIKSTHEPRRKQLKFLKEATEDVVRSLTESYITAPPPTDGTADSLVTKPEVPKYRRELWRRPLYKVNPVDSKIPTRGGSGWYSSIENAIKGRFGRDQIYVGKYYLFTLLPGHYDIRAGDDGPYWYFGGFHDEEPKIEISGIIETYNSQEPYYDWVTKYPKGKYILYDTTSYAAVEQALQNGPITESADEFEYDSPEVEDDAFGGEEVRFFNQEESYPTSTLDESIDPTKLSLYHVSPKANITTLQPKLSSKPLKGEENTTKRISAAPSIDGCFRAVGYDLKPGESAKYYIYMLILTKDSKVVKPTKDQVPDQSLGNEYWVLTPTKTKSLGYIEITADPKTGSYSFDESHVLDENQILTLDDPARFMNEATTATKSSYKKLYPVYINLFSNNTVFGKLIKTVTGSPYTHATIGLDSTMNNMYSFSGIPYNTAPLFLCSGFVRESIWSPAFTRCAFFHTYVTFVDKEGRDKIQKKINNFIKNYDKYDYNTPGLFEYYFGATNTKHHDENKKSMWFCSEFVTACVNASDEVEGFEDIMQSPEDLAHMPNTFDLGEWHVEDFDQKKMDILTKRAEAKFRKNPEMSSGILSEDASGSWIMDESAREKLRAVYKNAQNSGREVYNKMRQHDVHKYVFNLDWKKLHDEFVRLFPKNSPATRFDLIGLILHSYLIPTKQSIENVTENIINQFKEIKKTVRDGYIKLLDIAKSIIFFWNKKLKDSALKYPSEELITESAGEKYYFNTSSESFRDKKYIKLEYNRYINRKPVKYTDVSMTRDLLDNIIKIIPEELEPAKILAARDAETLTDIIAEQFSKREDVSNRRGGLKTPYYSFGVNAIFRALEAARLNKDDNKHETYIDGIRGLVPMDISDAEFTEYLAGMMSQLEEVMKFLTSLILENLTLFGFTLKDQERLLTSTATRADIKKLKREIDRKLLMSSVTDPNNGSVTFDLHYGRLGKVIVSQAIIRSDGKWLTPSRYLIRAREYDYIIVAHGHPNTTDRWEIDPITVNGKEYCYVDDLVADINKRDNAKILITCCNTNDYNLAAQFDYLNGVEYANANVVMESAVKGTTKLSKIVSSTISELEALIYGLTRWKDGINTLLDEQGIIITNSPINYIEFTGKIDKFAVSHVRKKVKPENVGETYAKVIGKIIAIYSEIIYTIRETIILMHQLRTDNLGKYIAKYDSNFSTFTVDRKFNTLQEAVHEMKLMQFINSDIEYSHSGTVSIFNENEIVGFPVHLNELDQLTEDVLRLDPPADYEGLTEAAIQKLYPVYVLLSHRSASALSNVIKALTHSQFSHAALSFDPKLTHMYSFGRNSPNSSKGSFRLESIKKDAYAMGEVPYSLYVVPCTAEQCKLIKKRLKYFAANKSNFTFDMAGLVKNGLGIESEPDDKWFCSRFVADVLNAGAPNGTKYVEHPSLMDPDDFRHTNFAQYVCGGLISDYDYLVAERITKDILHSAADVRSQVGHLKNENTNMIIPSYIKYHNQIWHYKYANDPEDINYPDD